jgi:hypothetical protein
LAKLLLFFLPKYTSSSENNPDYLQTERLIKHIQRVLGLSIEAMNNLVVERILYFLEGLDFGCNCYTVNDIMLVVKKAINDI